MKEWIQLNEKIFELESILKKNPERLDELKEQWNNLIDKADKTVGCVKREKYDKRREKREKDSTETGREETKMGGESETEEGNTSKDAVRFHGCVA